MNHKKTSIKANPLLSQERIEFLYKKIGWNVNAIKKIPATDAIIINSKEWIELATELNKFRGVEVGIFDVSEDYYPHGTLPFADFLYVANPRTPGFIQLRLNGDKPTYIFDRKEFSNLADFLKYVSNAEDIDTQLYF